MITNALSNPTPVAPAPAPVGPPTASGDGGSEAGQFARLLDNASPHTDKTGATRASSTHKVPLAKERQKERVDKGHAPANPTTKQAEPTDTPIECPAENEAGASEQAAGTAAPAVDAAALLATLPPLPSPPQRPYPVGNNGPVRSSAPGSTRSPVNDIDPAQSPPDLGDTRDSRNAVRGGTGASFAESLRDAKAPASEAQAKAAAVEQAALPLPAHMPVATGVSASAPAEARIAATPGSADFASQLGAQLSTFVKDGIEHAKLELHPVELGPVTVQIQIDGNTAQVNLTAEQAPTRAALEDALPQLAGSLREAGLTLTGGGVFEQPRQPNQPNAGRGDGSTRSDMRSERDTAARESVTLQPPAAPRRRGVVDLVA